MAVTNQAFFPFGNHTQMLPFQLEMGTNQEPQELQKRFSISVDQERTSVESQPPQMISSKPLLLLVVKLKEA